MFSSTVAKTYMFIAAILMGNVSLFVFFLGGYPAYTIALLRGIFGSFFLFLFLLKTRSLSKEFLKNSFKHHWKHLLLIGIVLPIEFYFYFSNVLTSGMAVAAFLLYTNGIFLLLFLIISGEEKVSKVNIFCFILVLVGIAIITEFWIGNILVIGVIMGLISGITLALYVFFKKKIYNKRIAESLDAEKRGNFDILLALWEQLVLIVAFLPIGFSDLFRLTIIDLLLALILGCFLTAFANILYNIGVKNDKGGSNLIIMYLEPTMAAINTAIFLQSLSIYTVIGGVLILIANFIVLKHSK